MVDRRYYTKEKLQYLESLEGELSHSNNCRLYLSVMVFVAGFTGYGVGYLVWGM